VDACATGARSARFPACGFGEHPCSPVDWLLCQAAPDTSEQGDPAPFVEEDEPTVEDEDFAPQAQGDQQRGQGQGLGRGRRGQGGQRGGGQFNQGPRTSPDSKWIASIKDFNVFIRSAAGDEERQLTRDGVTNNAYGRLEWAPDSRTLVAWRIEPGDNKRVYLVRSSPQGGGPAVLEERSYPQAGDRFTAYELSVFDVATQKQTKPEVDRVDFGSPNLRWNSDNVHFTYEKVDRGHQRFRVIEIDARTGAARRKPVSFDLK